MNDLQNFVRDNWKTILSEANSRLDKVKFLIFFRPSEFFPQQIHSSAPKVQVKEKFRL